MEQRPSFLVINNKRRINNAELQGVVEVSKNYPIENKDKFDDLVAIYLERENPLHIMKHNASVYVSSGYSDLIYRIELPQDTKIYYDNRYYSADTIEFENPIVWCNWGNQLSVEDQDGNNIPVQAVVGFIMDPKLRYKITKDVLRN